MPRRSTSRRKASRKVVLRRFTDFRPIQLLSYGTHNQEQGCKIAVVLGERPGLAIMMGVGGNTGIRTPKTACRAQCLTASARLERPPDDATHRPARAPRQLPSNPQRRSGP